MSDQHTIRVVIFREGECFIASAVDVDIAAQGKTRDEALNALRVVMHAELSERGGDLSEIGPAPDMIRQMYEGDDNRLISREKIAA